MKAVVSDDKSEQFQQEQQEPDVSEYSQHLLSCNTDLVRSYDVLKALPMGHKGKFYQRILSQQRKQQEVSQSLPNSLHGNEVRYNGNVVDEVQDEGTVQTKALLANGAVVEENGAQSPNQEIWFNTWPERCEKGENGKTSPRAHNHLNNTRMTSNTCDSNSTNGKLSLNEALQNISLAYSPLTKKLHLIQPNTEQENLLDNTRKTIDIDIDSTQCIDTCAQSQISKETDHNTNDLAITDNLPKKTHRRIEAGSFSSTVSSISDISPSGSLLDTDDNNSECSDIGFTKAAKKKGLLQYFNRNVFSWKTANVSTVGVWNLFNKASLDHCVPESPKHEGVVASSSALIQLKRPSNLPAKTLEEEEKHRVEYEAMVAAAKRKEALNSVAKQKQQKLQLQLEEQLATATKHFTQTVLPNWETNRNQRKTRDLWWQGLPSSVRGRVWQKAIGNDLNITPQLYDICLARAQTLLHSDTNQSHNENCFRNKNNTIYSRNNSGHGTEPCGTPNANSDCDASETNFADFESNFESSQTNNKTIEQIGTNLDRKNSVILAKSDCDYNIQPCLTVRSNLSSLVESCSRKNSSANFESLVNSRKSSGVSILPCGTPISNLDGLESSSRKNSANFELLVNSRKNSGLIILPCGTPALDRNNVLPISRKCSVSSASCSDCCLTAFSLDQQQQASLAAVQLDIARVFPNLCIFQEGGPYSEVLHSLLAAYVCYRPDVGYVQGMAYLAAILTLNLPTPHSFTAFSNLLNRPLHLAAYSLDEAALAARYRAFQRCLGAQLPTLCAHMARARLTPDLYLLDWLYTVYARAMPLDVVSRVWDVWLRDGEEEFLFRAALGILHLYQDELVKMDFLHGSQFLTRLPEDLSSENLFRSIKLVSTSVGKLTFAQIVQGFYSNSGNCGN